MRLGTYKHTHILTYVIFSPQRFLPKLSFVFLDLWTAFEDLPAMEMVFIDADMNQTDEHIRNKHLSRHQPGSGSASSEGQKPEVTMAPSQLSAFPMSDVNAVHSFRPSAALQKFALQAHPIEPPPVACFVWTKHSFIVCKKAFFVQHAKSGTKVDVARPLATSSDPVSRRLFQEDHVEAKLPYPYFDDDKAFNQWVAETSMMDSGHDSQIGPNMGCGEDVFNEKSEVKPPTTPVKEPTVQAKFVLDPMKYREAQAKKRQRWNGVCLFVDGPIDYSPVSPQFDTQTILQLFESSLISENVLHMVALFDNWRTPTKMHCNVVLRPTTCWRTVLPLLLMYYGQMATFNIWRQFLIIFLSVLGLFLCSCKLGPT